MARFTVWVPTGEYQAYSVEAESPEKAKEKLLAEIDSEERSWSDWEDSWFADTPMADWQVDEY